MPLITLTTEDQTLKLAGVLDNQTLNVVWDAREQIIANMTKIDVSDLIRVDSAGLALLTQFSAKAGIKLININPQLQGLIELYDLQTMVI